LRRAAGEPFNVRHPAKDRPDHLTPRAVPDETLNRIMSARD
jgi:hypothetical protein